MKQEFTINHMSSYKRGSNQFVKKVKPDPTRLFGFKYKTLLSVYIILALMLLVVYVGYQVKQAEPAHYTSPLPSGAMYTWSTPPVGKKFIDTRAQKLYNFLYQHNSPLADFSDKIVAEADTNAIDYTLIPAISGKESSFGNAIPENSYNAWGIMQWDAKGKRSVRHFASWNESIAFEAHLLSVGYRKNMYSAIQAKYCPSFECSPTWTSQVAGFSAEIANL